MKSVVLWLTLLASGFGLMLCSYFGAIAPDRTTSWSRGCLWLALEGDIPDIGPSDATNLWPVQMRLLEPVSFASSIVNSSRIRSTPSRKIAVRAQLDKILVAIPANMPGLDTNLLSFGRMPVPGEPELLAGWQVNHASTTIVAGREFQVVGGLKRGAQVWANAYLLPKHGRWQDLFKLGQIGVYQALATQTDEQSARISEFRNRQPDTTKERFIPLSVSVRVGRLVHVIYVVGMALMLIGGSGLFIACPRFLAELNLPRALVEPLREMAHHKRLLWSLHLVFFGLIVLSSLVVYDFPDVQNQYLLLIENLFADERYQLAAAARACRSGNVLQTALVIFAYNFFIATLLIMTLPSFLIPGIGIPLAGFRAIFLGVVLAPTTANLDLVMLPHSVTLLLEFEGYILAAFLGLLMPLALFRSHSGQPVIRRYLHAAGVSLKGQIWVAAVLLIAAIYEAIELILMMKI